MEGSCCNLERVVATKVRSVFAGKSTYVYKQTYSILHHPGRASHLPRSPTELDRTETSDQHHRLCAQRHFKSHHRRRRLASTHANPFRAPSIRSRQVTICRAFRIIHALEVLPLDQALDALLHHLHVGHEPRVELLDHLRDELLVLEFLALPAVCHQNCTMREKE